MVSAPVKTQKNKVLQIAFLSLLLLLKLSVSFADQVTHSFELSLSEAETLALTNDPGVAQLSSRANALTEQSIADQQFQDPLLIVGMMSLPVDSFSRSQEPMTQLQLGLKQRFPRGRTLHYQGKKSQALAEELDESSRNEQRRVLNAVRSAYFELYYQQQAKQIIQDNRQWFDQLVAITESHYSSGKRNQQDVIQAQLERDRLDDREANVITLLELAQSDLAKWVGIDHAQRSLVHQLPKLQVSFPLEDNEINNVLLGHPLVRSQNEAIKASEADVSIAEQQYWPGFSVDVRYGDRIGRDPDGDKRDDFVSVMAMVDLPIFTSKRQDKRLQASQYKAQSARFAKTDLLRELKRRSQRELAHWQQLKERVGLYEKKLLPNAKLNVNAALKAYQSGVSDFPTVVSAQITQLNLELEFTKLKTAQYKTYAMLRYLLGDGDNALAGDSL